MGDFVELPLQKDMVSLVDFGDLDTLKQWKWHAIMIGHIWYARRDIESGHRYLHRFLLDAPRGSLVDHANGNGLDNRRSNLRFCTRSQNGANRAGEPRGLSGFRGVHSTGPAKSKPWEASIRVRWKRYRLGCFYDPVEAALAYDAAALKYFGEFASLNFPLPKQAPS